MPHALHISTDSRVTGYDRSRPQPILPPWIEVTAEAFAQAQGMAYPRWIDGGLVDDPPAEPTEEERRAALYATPLSKLALRRALRSRGLEPALNQLLSSSPQAAADWADAQTVRLDDPLLSDMLPAFATAAGMTDTDIAALVQEASA